MGVKDLWQVLSPVCERKSLWELQDKTIAVDLSCWVCDSQNVAEFSTQPNMYLRNLFFRTSTLLLLGAHPIFVLDGEAPLLKANVMDQRNAARGFTQSQKAGNDPSKKGKRRQFKSIQKKCCELLDCMGIKYIQCEGEAEALCALLNKQGLVDSCISQDSDCFLYGAEIVLRNFTTTAGNSSTGGPGFSVDSYSMTCIEKSLGLTRNKLIALSLLCGCDYLQHGVAGVGKESALKFIATVEDNAVLDRLRKWRNDFLFEQMEEERKLGGCEQCGHIGKKKLHMNEGCPYCQCDKGCTPSFNPWSLCQMEVEKRKIIITELTIRKKALLDPEFPSEDIIEEFLKPNITVPSKIDTRWEQPNIVNFLHLAVRFLRWEEAYAFDKFLPILTRWVLLRRGEAHSKSAIPCPVFPAEIKRARVLRGIASYEIKWGDTEGLFDSIISATAQDSEVDAESAGTFCTIEPKSLVEDAYPELVNRYNSMREEAKQAKRKAKSKSKKGSEQIVDDRKKCDKCGGHEGCLCRFAVAEPSKADKENKPVTDCQKRGETKTQRKRKPKEKTDARQKRLSGFLSRRQNEAAPVLKDIPLEQLFDTSLNMQDLDDDYGEADLSAIVMSIVGGEDVPRTSPESPVDVVHYENAVSIDSSPEERPTANIHPLSASSSDDELGKYIPLMERIKMRNQTKSKRKSFGLGISLANATSSPICKRPKFDQDKHPYSPLAGEALPDSPAPNKRRSVVTSEAARRFSASIEAFSRQDSPSTSTDKSTRISSYYRESNAYRLSLGVSRLLDSDE